MSTWERDINNDLQPLASVSTEGQWEVDGSGDLMPSVGTDFDLYWSLDGDDLFERNAYVFDMVGGGISGGSAGFNRTQLVNMLGGAVAGGLTSWYARLLMAMSGGGVAGGSFDYSTLHQYIVDMLGGAVAGGEAVVLRKLIWEFLGGAVAGGSADIDIIEDESSMIGGAVVGGAAAILFGGLTQYIEGVISATRNSKTIMGKRTLWQYNIDPLTHFLKVRNGKVVYEIASVDSNRQVTLKDFFEGASVEDIEYQISRRFTSTLKLCEVLVGDIDWKTHLSLNMIRRIDEVLGHRSTPQFLNMLLQNTYSSVTNVKTRITLPENGMWYNTKLVISSGMGFSALVGVLYEDEFGHENDRTCLAHAGGCLGYENITYLSRPNGAHIELQFVAGVLQARQTVNTGIGTKMLIDIEYLSH